MPRKYPAEVRRQVIELARSGTKVAQLAETFGISEATIYSWLKQEKIDRGEVSGLSTEGALDLAAAKRLHLDDFSTFIASRTDAFDEVDEFQAIRFRVRAELAERVFEQFVVDIGFAKPATWKPDRVRTSDFFSFAGIELLELPAIPLASTWPRRSTPTLGATVPRPGPARGLRTQSTSCLSRTHRRSKPPLCARR